MFNKFCLLLFLLAPFLITAIVLLLFSHFPSLPLCLLLICSLGFPMRLNLQPDPAQIQMAPKVFALLSLQQGHPPLVGDQHHGDAAHPGEPLKDSLLPSLGSLWGAGPAAGWVWVLLTAVPPGWALLAHPRPTFPLGTWGQCPQVGQGPSRGAVGSLASH